MLDISWRCVCISQGVLSWQLAHDPVCAGPVTPVIKEEKSFLYAESKRARLEREKEERKVRMEQV